MRHGDGQKFFFIIVSSMLFFACSRSGERQDQSSAKPTPTPVVVRLQANLIDLSDEPIATIGHGSMFDRKGKEIKVTPEFINTALDYYLTALVRITTQEQRAKFEEKRSKVFEGRNWDQQSTAYIKAEFIDWLLAEVQPSNAGVIKGKIGLLKLKSLKSGQPSDEVKRLLSDEGIVGKPIAVSATPPAVHFSTLAGGAAYLAECTANFVPTPPDWGTSQWVSQGILSDAEEFISEEREAEVFTFQSSAPEGVCIALPRSDGDDIELLGIICQGKASSKVCFWDNQEEDEQFTIDKGDVVPISDFAGGADLDGGTGGVCTECHAGENPFIIHPFTNLGEPQLSAFPLKPDNWYDPAVHPSWPQNAGPTNILDSVASPGRCTSCHTQSGVGRFPKLSSVIPGYCGIILPSAMERTMPPGSPNDPDYEAHRQALLNACNNATTSPIIRVEEAVIDYREVELGFSFSKALVIHNDGDAPLTFTVTNPSAGDPDFPQWDEINVEANVTLNPGDPPKILRQVYKPGALGMHAIQLDVTSNDIVTPTIPVTLTGTGVAPIPIDSVLVLDRSGSMADQAGDRQKIQAMQIAANLYADLLRDDIGGTGTGDKLGFVKYNHNNSVYMTLDFMNATKRTEVQDLLSNASIADNSRLRPSGQTGIGGAMETAAGVIGGPIPDRKQVMVVMTDGKENEEPNINDVVGPIQAGNGQLKMYSIGLGADIEPTKLQNITNISNGYHQVSDSLSGVTLFDLENFYFKIFVNATEMDLVVDPTHVVNLLTPATINVDSARIITSDRSATFLVLDDPVLRPFYDLEFVSPTGQIIVPGVTIGGIPIQEMSRRTYRIYRIIFPDVSQAGTYVGDWLLRLRPNGKWSRDAVKQALVESEINYSSWVSPFAGQVPIGFSAAVASDYHLEVQVTPTNFLPGADVKLTATLTDRGWPAPQGQIDVTATAPDGTNYPMTLFDDGTHGDVTAGDATWTNRFTNTALPKVYKFFFHSIGKNERGELAPREATRYLTLMQPEPNPPDKPCIACTLLRVLLLLALLLLFSIFFCTCIRPRFARALP